MTNHYSIVDGPDGEPTVVHKKIRIRGYYYDEIKRIVREEGWDAAAERVCSYCGGFILPEDEQVEDFTDVEHGELCGCDDPTPSNPQAPI